MKINFYRQKRGGEDRSRRSRPRLRLRGVAWKRRSG
jgi:hypothetical protein